MALARDRKGRTLFVELDQETLSAFEQLKEKKQQSNKQIIKELIIKEYNKDTHNNRLRQK